MMTAMIKINLLDWPKIISLKFTIIRSHSVNQESSGVWWNISKDMISKSVIQGSN